MKSPCKRLPDGELEIMQALWDQDGPATRAQLEKSLFSSHPIPYVMNSENQPVAAQFANSLRKEP